MGGVEGQGQGAGAAAEGAGQAAPQSAQVGLPSTTTLVQTGRTALAQAQAQQAGVVLTLSAGAQSLLGGSALLGMDGRSASNQETSTPVVPGGAGSVASDTAVHAAQDTAQGVAAELASGATDAASGLAFGPGGGGAATGAGVGALVADVMQAADAVLADPLATEAQKTMASQLVRMVSSMAGQSASSWAGGASSGLAGSLAAGLASSVGADLALLQAEGSVSGATSGAAGGAVVTTAGLYGLASNAVLAGRLNMATALQNMGATLGEEIVLPGGIVQLSQTGGLGAVASAPAALAGNALTNALLPELFKVLSALVADQSVTDAQKAAASALFQILDTEGEGAEQIPQALLNPLLAAALMPALTPSQRGRLVRAALAGEVEDMGLTEDLALSGGGGAGALRAALRRNGAYLAAVQQPLLNRIVQQAQEVDPLLAGWSVAARSRAAGEEDVLEGSSVLALSQNLMADSPYMGALSSTSLTPILIMSWAALLSGCLPRAFPFVPRLWRRANKKRWHRKNRRTKMDLQNLLFTDGVVEV